MLKVYFSQIIDRKKYKWALKYIFNWMVLFLIPLIQNNQEACAKIPKFCVFSEAKQMYSFAFFVNRFFF